MESPAGNRPAWLTHSLYNKTIGSAVAVTYFDLCLNSCLEESDQSARVQGDDVRGRGRLNLIVF